MREQFDTDRGTRFRLYPQMPVGRDPVSLETVTVSSPAGTVGPGPSDHRMYALHPIGKTVPYGRVEGRGGPWLYLPPWDGPIAPPAMPGPGGHFDHLDPTDPGFDAAHLFGTVRFTLDVWEAYLGAPVKWHFRDRFERLELAILDGWANAHMGFGYIETGSRLNSEGRVIDYSLNFDVIAHEVGHALLVALTGPFKRGVVSGDFEAFHEASSDWVALITSLHFESTRRELLDNTSGNLDTFNRFSRFGEISGSDQIRLANNEQIMDDYVRGWASEHFLAKPLIGALFDIFVDIYHEYLLEAGGVSPALERLADRAERDPGLRPRLQHGFDKAYDRDPTVFEDALCEARDMMGRMLCEVWRSIDKDNFEFVRLPHLLREIDADLTGGRFTRILDIAIALRNLDTVRPGPRLDTPGVISHCRSSRMLIPDD